MSPGGIILGALNAWHWVARSAKNQKDGDNHGTQSGWPGAWAGPGALNATILYTWLVMALLVVGSWLGTRKLSTGARISKWQNLLEVLVANLREQIHQVSQQDPGPYLPFIGTLFIFISFSNLLTILPGYHPPTDSLSTTAALALCVLGRYSLGLPARDCGHRALPETHGVDAAFLFCPN
jgi:F0F1-type ATP synthase membrane subunit a